MEMDSHQALAALAWQIELGADVAVGEAPVDRYALPDRMPGARAPAKPAQGAAAKAPVAAPPVVASDPLAEAEALAAGARDLPALEAALAGYEHCELKRGARNLVFADGMPGARLMIVGEAPGRDEDREGKPFVGRAGQLLDRMLAAIDLDRAESVYITNVLPWRPPQNRDPKPEEIAMMQPFLRRHIALAKPEVLVAVGNHACHALLGKRGILRLRGHWTEAEGLPCLPMTHPAYLLRNPAAKREAWADLLEIRAKLEAAAP
ncbi:uracil-DNA glycosylase [Pseudaestuariivita atlantica]|uniref:Type-4 uracil-DNA glycosylase n=1 Tax=Pseudaestuariivita atlantica TaxID=1317121 RepID=A0A0L1JLG2_9RHOB|nr:uracil-DNA glycosylase [Pseudaestuariivita atlantica]KNG92589.1 uracil-DNA glycosylase [Pseudaestuariivita atlantica]